MLVSWGRKSYERREAFKQKSRIVRAFALTLPMSNMVLKPWYPTYIRSAGIFIWLWELTVLYLVIFHRFR